MGLCQRCALGRRAGVARLSFSYCRGPQLRRAAAGAGLLLPGHAARLAGASRDSRQPHHGPLDFYLRSPPSLTYPHQIAELAIECLRVSRQQARSAAVDLGRLNELLAKAGEWHNRRPACRSPALPPSPAGQRRVLRAGDWPLQAAPRLGDAPDGWVLVVQMKQEPFIPLLQSPRPGAAGHLAAQLFPRHQLLPCRAGASRAAYSPFLKSSPQQLD